MQTKKRFQLTLWIVAGLILFIGIIQVLSFLPGQLELMQQAEAQGVPAQQISTYFRQQVLPQFLSYLLFPLSFISILALLGKLYEKFDEILTQKSNYLKQLPPLTQQPQTFETDTLFDEFEIVQKNTIEKE